MPLFSIIESTPRCDNTTQKRTVVVYDTLADAKAVLTCLNTHNEINQDVFSIEEGGVPIPSTK